MSNCTALQHRPRTSRPSVSLVGTAPLARLATAERRRAGVCPHGRCSRLPARRPFSPRRRGPRASWTSTARFIATPNPARERRPVQLSAPRFRTCRGPAAAGSGAGPAWGLSGASAGPSSRARRRRTTRRVSQRRRLETQRRGAATGRRGKSTRRARALRSGRGHRRSRRRAPPWRGSTRRPRRSSAARASRPSRGTCSALPRRPRTRAQRRAELGALRRQRVPLGPGAPGSTARQHFSRRIGVRVRVWQAPSAGRTAAPGSSPDPSGPLPVRRRRRGRRRASSPRTYFFDQRGRIRGRQASQIFETSISVV